MEQSCRDCDYVGNIANIAVGRLQHTRPEIAISWQQS